MVSLKERDAILSAPAREVKHTNGRNANVALSHNGAKEKAYGASALGIRGVSRGRGEWGFLGGKGRNVDRVGSLLQEDHPAQEGVEEEHRVHGKDLPLRLDDLRNEDDARPRRPDEPQNHNDAAHSDVPQTNQRQEDAYDGRDRQRENAVAQHAYGLEEANGAPLKV